MHERSCQELCEVAISLQGHACERFQRALQARWELGGSQSSGEV